ncbi:MAG: glutathione S-transferase N-terminal domain-containing protein [Hyphomicrobium sp.]|nr:glutathione S-transferase N-terminal domain-containing protein [Hyphomicrobium sp.]
MVDDTSDDLIDLYFWTTPNGFKIAIMLEELGLAYRGHLVDINKGEQFDPKFLEISPNNKIPAIVDPDGPDGQPLPLFESGAILQYLGRKYSAFYPTNERKKADVDQWLFWQVGGVGPMLGQANHFRKYAKEKVPYAIERYTTEAARLFGVMERRLADRPFLAGEYSIADIACFPWVQLWPGLGVEIDDYPNIKSWLERIAARPAVKRGLEAAQNPSVVVR